jgi:hypothetical protein
MTSAMSFSSKMNRFLKLLGISGTAAALVTATAQAEVLPPFIVTACATGTHGDPSMPRMRAGDTGQVGVIVMNFGEYEQSVNIQSVSFVIHHQSGDVTTTNLVASPTDVPCFDDLVISAPVIIPPGESDILLIDALVTGTYDPDGPDPHSMPDDFHAQIGTQLIITRDGRPTLKMAPSATNMLAVSWSLSYENWQLQTSEDLNGQWTSVSETPATLNGTYVHTFSTANRPRQFFRLVKP